MENISKNITLECAKNRFYENYMPALDSETLEPMSGSCCWGDFPYDVIIEPNDMFGMYELRNNLPMLCTCNKFIFRFGNIANLYGWVKKIARETIFYKLGYRIGQLKWIEIDYNFYDSGNTFEILSKLPNPIDTDVCKIVGVHDEADKFNSYFRCNGDKRCELDFLKFVESIFSGTLDYNYQTPYLDLSVTILEDVNSVGEMISDEQFWKPNKKYYLGDIVKYEDDYYVLEHGDMTEEIEVSGQLYDIVFNDFKYEQEIYNFIDIIPENLDDLDKNRLNILYRLTPNVPDFKIVQVYYKGEYSEQTKLTKFDNDLKHWSKIETFNSGDTEEELVVASKLDVFRSTRKSYDNNNRELPFNVVESGETKDVALIYTFGYTNYSIKNNGACVDYFNKVEFLRNLSDEDPYVIEYNNSGESKDIIVTDIVDSGFSYVRFTYYSGCEVLESGNTQYVNMDSGVKYSETRTIRPTTVEVQYDSSAVTEFTYFEVSSTSEESREVDNTKACAKIRYKANSVLSIGGVVQQSVPLHVFSNSKLFGSTFIENENEEVHISRGAYGAFERHNILGEVNSMDDLQNYRNNYFKL